MIKFRPVQWVEERLYCDRCNTEMDRSPIMGLSNPPTYTYICRSCSAHQYRNECYPRVMPVVEKEEEQTGGATA